MKNKILIASIISVLGLGSIQATADTKILLYNAIQPQWGTTCP